MRNYSFIIRSRNEERWIGHTIQSVIDNFDNPEIIVVDNESTDDTLDVVKQFINDRNNLNIKIVSIGKKEYTPGRAINLGVDSLEKSNSNTIVCVLSSHCAIDNLDKEHLEALLQEEDCCAVFGKQMPIYRGKKILYRYVWENFSYDHVIKNPIENIKNKRVFFHNAFSFINFSDLKKYPFDELSTAKEDRVWIAKMNENNKYCYFTPFLTCYHYWTPNGATWKGQG